MESRYIAVGVALLMGSALAIGFLTENLMTSLAMAGASMCISIGVAVKECKAAPQSKS